MSEIKEVFVLKPVKNENRGKYLERLEDLCTNLRNSMKIVLENSAFLENEFNNTKIKLLQTEKALEEALG